MPRLFVAVWPPPAVIDLLRGVPRWSAPGVRWTTADRWHVTLRFLGSVDEAAAAAALHSVRVAPATAGLGPMVEPLGEAVIVVPVAGLDTVAAAVAEATADIEEPADRLPFVGHLTLGRVGPAATDLRPGHPIVGHPIAASFPVGEIALVRSDRDATGARYSTVATHRLAL